MGEKYKRVTYTVVILIAAFIAVVIGYHHRQKQLEQYNNNNNELQNDQHSNSPSNKPSSRDHSKEEKAETLNLADSFLQQKRIESDPDVLETMRKEKYSNYNSNYKILNEESSGVMGIYFYRSIYTPSPLL